MSTRTDRPIRIAYFSDAPWAGGAEEYLYLLASHLHRDEFDPALLVDRNPRLAGFKERFAAAGIPVREVSIDLPRSLVGACAFVAALREMRPAILHCNLPGPWGAQYSLVAPLARLAGVRHVVSTEHLPMVPPFTKGRALKRFGTHWIERVITVSEDNVGHLVGMHGVPRAKITVVRIGIPEPAPAPSTGARGALGIAASDFLCIMVGSLEERKGHRTAFEALAALPSSVKLIVAGDGGGLAGLRARVAELGIGDRVRFLGFRNDVPALLRTSDVLLVPSTIEATPYVIIEAMAAGIPVVASNVHGIPELVIDGATGILVAPGASGELATAIGSLAGDRNLRIAMGEGGRRRFDAVFRIERCVGETEAIYRDVLGIRGSREGRV